MVKDQRVCVCRSLRSAFRKRGIVHIAPNRFDLKLIPRFDELVLPGGFAGAFGQPDALNEAVWGHEGKDQTAVRGPSRP